MASSMFLLSATALRRPAASLLLKNNFLPHLNPIRSMLSVTNTPPSSSSFHSSATKNNAASVASQRVMMIPCFVNDDSDSDDDENETAVTDVQRYPLDGSVSRLPLQALSPNEMLSDDEEEEAETDLGWRVTKEDEDAVHLQMDLPGVGKEDLKVTVVGTTLTIKGEEKEEDEVGDQADEQNGNKGTGRTYNGEFDLPPNLFKLCKIKAEIKNGVLKVSLPKLKEEERKDIIQVQVQ